MNRLAIYVIYDKDGIVDDYIPHFLNALSKFVSHFVIVCNGLLNEEGRRKLEKFTDDIYLRPNEGYDGGAIQDVFLNLYGWGNVYKFDELIISNDTFYGPIFEMSEMFDKMDSQNVDFWGVTEQTEHLSMKAIDTSVHGVDLTEYNEKGLLPKHVQSYFICINERLLKSQDFKQFWENMPKIKDRQDASYLYEIPFSVVFAQKGYSYSTYINSLDCNEMKPENNYFFTHYDPVKLAVQLRSPFIKRIALHYSGNRLHYLASEYINELMKIVDTFGIYSSDLIWQNLLRVGDISDIKNVMHLNYILPTKATNSARSVQSMPKTVVVAHLFYAHLLEECLGFLRNVPYWIDIVITSSNQELADKAKSQLINREGAQVRLVENRGRDMSALLVGCHDIFEQYEFLCFVHDKDANAMSPKREAESFRSLLWENTLSSPEYIMNILNEFKESPRLGFLSVPQPYHGNFLNLFSKEWGGEIENVQQLASRLGVSLALDASKQTFSLGNAFWCRTSALKPLHIYPWSYDDFSAEPMPVHSTISHAIERVYPYVAQFVGYFSGVVMSDNHAAARLVDYEEIIRRDACDSLYNIEQLIQKRSYSLRNFCSNRNVKYIYGTGQVAKKCADYLNFINIEYDAFIVSDGEEKPSKFLCHPVYHFSEIDFNNRGIGIILGLGKKYTKEVVEKLKSKGISNFFTLH